MIQLRHPALRSAASLGLIAILGTGLLAAADWLTADRIAEQERRVVLRQLGQIVPADRYDNELQDDRFSFRDEAWFPRGQEVVAYRARREGRPVAVILKFSAIHGYNGPIGLLAGINADGTVAGIRVIFHKETPGLGDGIEREKSDWVLGFDGKSLDNPPPEEWAVRRDGGSFDQFTGATITPRAIVEAVRKALEYFREHRDKLFNTPASPPG